MEQATGPLLEMCTVRQEEGKVQSRYIMLVECNIISSIWWYNSDRCCLEGGRNPLEIPSSGPQARADLCTDKIWTCWTFRFEMCKSIVIFQTLKTVKSVVKMTIRRFLAYFGSIWSKPWKVKFCLGLEVSCWKLIVPCSDAISSILYSSQYLEICISLTVIAAITLGLLPVQIWLAAHSCSDDTA